MSQIMTWKELSNGMMAGEFAYLYVHHFRDRRNYRPQYRNSDLPSEKQ